jgi:threonine aldolase
MLIPRSACSRPELTWRAGVDVLCFGGTKNGLPVGDAILFFDRNLSGDFAWRVKQAGQLASKMRFISAPWLGMLENGTWLRNAAHANAMAQRLHSRNQGCAGCESATHTASELGIRRVATRDD